MLKTGSKLPNQLSNELDHQTLLAVINNLSEAVLTVNDTGLITLSNSTALNLLDANVVIGRSISEVFKLIDAKNQPINLWKLIQENPSGFSSSELSLIYPDSSAINIDLNFKPVKLPFSSKLQSGYVAVFRDISREKSREEERDEFISVASHELRTPVAVMEANISNALLLAGGPAVPDSLKHSLTSAHDQILFLGSLINDLAMLSRAERGRLALTIEVFKASSVIDSLVHDYSPQAARKQLTFTKELNEEPGDLLSSQLYVREIMQNLITNALKYTEKGSVTVSARKKAGGIEFTVVDTGIGISQSEKSKLFTKFFRSDDWRVKQVSGTGLGLYVSAKLAKLIGGSIEVESHLNRGTTVRLFVPNHKP